MEPVVGFDGIGTSLSWFCDPTMWKAQPGKREGMDGGWKVNASGELILSPPAKKDFWRRTYYQPLLIKDDGPCLFATVPLSEAFTCETSFTLDAMRQFDQAGILVRIDPEHWIKAGIEHVDGAPRLSCVVTNGFSDWSTQPWPGGKASLRLRVSKVGADDSYVVEAAQAGAGRGKKEEDHDEWRFIRIAHLGAASRVAAPAEGDQDAAPEGKLWVGVFGCCPEDQQGCKVVFHSFEVRPGTSFRHNADGNADP